MVVGLSATPIASLAVMENNMFFPPGTGKKGKTKTRGTPQPSQSPGGVPAEVVLVEPSDIAGSRKRGVEPPVLVLEDPIGAPPAKKPRADPVSPPDSPVVSPPPSAVLSTPAAALPDPSTAGEWIMKALQSILPSSALASAPGPLAGLATGPRVRDSPPAASFADPDPYDRGTVPSISGRSSRPRRREDSYARERLHAGVARGRDSDHPAAAARGDVISIAGESDSEFGYHRPIAVHSRAWGDRDLSPDRSGASSDGGSLRSFPSESGAPQLVHESEIPAVETSGRADAFCAVDILTKYCPQLAASGESSQQSAAEKSIFRMKSAFDVPDRQGPSAVKMDAPYKSCFQGIDRKKSRMKAYSRDCQANFRVGAEDYDKYLSSPLVPDVAVRVGDAHAKKTNSSNPLRSPAFKAFESALLAVDKSARSAMRLAMYQGYILTALTEAESLGISQTDQQRLSRAATFIADLQFEQATRTALFCTFQRRTNVVDNLKIEKESARALSDLPSEGKDLFHDQFQSVLDNSITASVTADQTAYKLSRAKQDRSSAASGQRQGVRFAPRAPDVRPQRDRPDGANFSRQRPPPRRNESWSRAPRGTGRPRQSGPASRSTVFSRGPKAPPRGGGPDF